MQTCAAATQNRAIVLPPQMRPNLENTRKQRRPQDKLRTPQQQWQWLPVQQEQEQQGKQWGQTLQPTQQKEQWSSHITEELPDYAAIDAKPHNRLVQTLFRSKMARAVGGDERNLWLKVGFTPRAIRHRPHGLQF